MSGLGDRQQAFLKKLSHVAGFFAFIARNFGGFRDFGLRLRENHGELVDDP